MLPKSFQICLGFLVFALVEVASASPVIKYLTSQVDKFGRIYYTCPTGLPEGQYCYMDCVVVISDGHGGSQISSTHGGLLSGEPGYLPEGALACTAWIE